MTLTPVEPRRGTGICSVARPRASTAVASASSPSSAATAPGVVERRRRSLVARRVQRSLNVRAAGGEIAWVSSRPLWRVRVSDGARSVPVTRAALGGSSTPDPDGRRRVAGGDGEVDRRRRAERRQGQAVAGPQAISALGGRADEGPLSPERTVLHGERGVSRDGAEDRAGRLRRGVAGQHRRTTDDAVDQRERDDELGALAPRFGTDDLGRLRPVDRARRRAPGGKVARVEIHPERRGTGHDRRRLGSRRHEGERACAEKEDRQPLAHHAPYCFRSVQRQAVLVLAPSLACQGDERALRGLRHRRASRRWRVGASTPMASR